MLKSLFEKSFWVKLFALNPSFFFKTRVLPQSRKAYTIQRHIIPIFRKPCQINGRCSVPRVFNLHLPTRRGFSATPEPTYRGAWFRRGEVPSPNGLGDSTPIPPMPRCCGLTNPQHRGIIPCFLKQVLSFGPTQ